MYCAGDGLASSSAAFNEYKGISDAGLFFEQVLSKPYLSQVGVHDCAKCWCCTTFTAIRLMWDPNQVVLYRWWLPHMCTHLASARLMTSKCYISTVLWIHIILVNNNGDSLAAGICPLSPCY